MQSEDKNKTKIDESTPPIFNSWNKLYAFVFTTLVVLIIVFYIFTKVFE